MLVVPSRAFWLATIEFRNYLPSADLGRSAWATANAPSALVLKRSESSLVRQRSIVIRQRTTSVRFVVDVVPSLADCPSAMSREYYNLRFVVTTPTLSVTEYNGLKEPCNQVSGNAFCDVKASAPWRGSQPKKKERVSRVSWTAWRPWLITTNLTRLRKHSTRFSETYFSILPMILTNALPLKTQICTPPHKRTDDGCRLTPTKHRKQQPGVNIILFLNQDRSTNNTFLLIKWCNFEWYCSVVLIRLFPLAETIQWYGGITCRSTQALQTRWVVVMWIK